MSSQNIEIVLGENLDLLQYSAKARRSNQVIDIHRPHGFMRNWDEGPIDQLCTLVRQRFEQIIATMPENLVKYITQRYARIPLYALHCPNSSFSASIMEMTRDGQPRNSIPEFGGILFNAAKVQPQDLEKENHHIHGNIWHELGHVATSTAVNSSNAISEAFANGVAGKFYNTLLPAMLDATSIQATTGLQLPDMQSQHLESAGYAQALYLASPLALQDFNIQKIWEIVTSLTVDQHSKLRPTSSDILQKMRNILGDEAATILQGPIFTPIKNGTQQLLFPESGRGAVFTTAFKVESNEGAIQVSDTTIDISIEAIGGNGAIVANPRMAGAKRFEYEGLIKIFTKIDGVDIEEITGFTCKIGRYKFELRKNDIIFKNE